MSIKIVNNNFMKYLLTTCCCALVVLSCKTKFCENYGHYDHHTIDTIDRVFLYPDYHNSWDTGRTKFVNIHFYLLKWEGEMIQQMAPVGKYILPFGSYLNGEWDAPLHYLKYVGKLPLFHVDSAIDDRRLFEVTYKLDSTLFNKPVFEDYLASNDSLFKTYILKPGSTVSVSYYKNDTAKVPRWRQPDDFPLDAITQAYNLYITDRRLKDAACYFMIPQTRYPVGGQQYDIKICD